MAEQHSDRIQSIQVLRILGGITITLYHQLLGYAMHIGEGLNLPDFDYQFGNAAMTTFFFISGYIVVYASNGHFGTLRNSRIFITRRMVRILPTYWLASILLLGLFLLRGYPLDWEAVGWSALVVPTWTNSDIGFPQPFLFVGWTLFLELVFYTVFAIGMIFGRRETLWICTGAAVIAVVCGMIFEPKGAVLFMMTRPLMLIFPIGIAFAEWRMRGGEFSPNVRWGLALAGTVAYFVLEPPPGGVDLGFDYLLWAGVPGLLWAFAITSGPLRVPFFGFVNRFADSMYGLYLFHVPIAAVWAWGWRRLVDGQPELFAVTLFAVSLVLSWFYYQWFERWMLGWLNNKLGAGRQSSQVKKSAGTLKPA